MVGDSTMAGAGAGGAGGIDGGAAGAAGNVLGMNAGAVGRISGEVADRALSGAQSWAAVPGFNQAAAGAAFVGRGARLTESLERLRAQGSAQYGSFGGFAPAIDAQFGAFRGVDGESSESIGRIGGGA